MASNNSSFVAHQFLHIDRQRAVLAHTEAPDFRPGSGVGWVELRGPVHFTIAIRIREVSDGCVVFVGMETPEDARDL